MLSAKNLSTLRPKKKFAARFIGLFEVQARIGTQAYRLSLPKQIAAIHPVFHVSLLEPYRYSDGVTPPPLKVEGQEEYEVDEVIDKGYRNSRIEYLVY